MESETINGSPSSTTLALLPHQKQLEEEIRKIDAKLADCYIGSLQVFAQAEIASRIILSSHGIREILEKLPEHSSVSGLPVSRRQQSPSVQGVFNAWKNLDPSLWPGASPWSGVPDESLKRFLVTFEDYASDSESVAQKRREKAAALFQKFNPSGMPFPEPVEKTRFSTLKIFIDYFTNVSHQSWTTTPEGFAGKLAEFEYFLLDVMKPKPFDNQKDLDEIIREAEQ